MFCVQVPDFITRQTLEFCRVYSLGKRGDGTDGNFSHQLVGAICENSIRYAYGQSFIKDLGKSDGGVDIVIADHKIDIKSTRIDRDVREYHTHAVPESQIRYEADTYLFCALNTKQMILTVTGWLPKAEFVMLSKVNKKGQISNTPNGKTFVNRYTTYEVKVADLWSDFDNFEELQDKMEFA